MLNIIAAVSNNNVIGSAGRIPWKLPADQQYFKKLTMGHPVIMGRKTFESLYHNLPGRKVIVLTHQKDYATHATNVVIAHSLDQALQIAANDQEIFIAGGQQIFQQFIEKADKIYLTRIDAEFSGDAFFPLIDTNYWQIKEKGKDLISNGTSYFHQVYSQKKNL